MEVEILHFQLLFEIHAEQLVVQLNFDDPAIIRPDILYEKPQSKKMRKKCRENFI